MADEKSTEPTKEDSSGSKDEFVRQQSYMSKQAKLDKDVFEKFGRPIDFKVNPVSSTSDLQEIDSDIVGGVNLWLQDPDNYGTKIGGIVAKEEMDRDKAQKILGEDVTIGEDVDWSGVNPQTVEIGKHLLQDPSLNDFMGRKTFGQSTMQSLFSPTDPLHYLYAKWTDQEVTSAKRTKESPFFEQGSAHNTGNALDLRASWDEVTKEELLEKKVQPSLTKAGWTMIPTTKGGSVATVKTKKTPTEKAKDQAWMKFTKNGETLFIELDDRNQHLHLHLGENQLEPTEQWE